MFYLQLSHFCVFFLHQIKSKIWNELFTAQYNGVKHGVSSSSEAGCAPLLQLVKVILCLCTWYRLPGTEQLCHVGSVFLGPGGGRHWNRAMFLRNQMSHFAQPQTWAHIKAMNTSSGTARNTSQTASQAWIAYEKTAFLIWMSMTVMKQPGIITKSNRKLKLPAPLRAHHLAGLDTACAVWDGWDTNGTVLLY